MGKPGIPRISGAEAVAAFERHGYQHDRTRGSHAILVKPESVHLSVPLHKELKTGTLRSLIRAAGLTVEEFVDLL